MKIRFVCGYYSDLAHKQIARRPEDYWNANFYVWAVKVGTHKRDFYVINSHDKQYHIRKDNFHEARRMFGRFVEQRMQDEGWLDAPLLVPVPSKNATLNARTSRSLAMVEESMADTALAGAVCDALRWTKEMAKAHEGGERRRDLLKPYLRVIPDISGRNVVLIDDLLTRGGTMLASKEKLEEAGATVLGGVVCGRTIYDLKTKAFGRQEYDLLEEADDFGRAAGQR